MIPIQASIVGYGGQPCTLFSAYDQENKVLVISMEARYRTDRKNDCLIIANDKQVERDKLFTDENLQDAISAFFMLQGGVAVDNVSQRLVFDDNAQRANPAHAIEKNGIDQSGQKYRINENITSGQVAALATCWHVLDSLDAIDSMLGMADRLMSVTGHDSGEFKGGDVHAEMAYKIGLLEKGVMVSI